MEASALSHASRRGLLARRSPLLRLQADDRLVAIVRAGNDSAFEVLWDRYRSRLLAYCRSIVRSAEDAEDVLQEVFVNAHAAMVADEREIQVRPWLYRIARNRSLNHLRKPVADGQDSMDNHIHAAGETTHDKAERRENVRQLVADVKTLPETQRTALLLREFNALSYDEIAQAMETTIPSVKSLLVRARISLAEASESRLLACDEVRVELAAASEGLAKLNGSMRRHVRECESCRTFRKQLSDDRKELAALAAPIGLLAIAQGLIAKLFSGAAGGGSASAAGAAAGSSAIAGGATAGGALLGGVGSAVGIKAAATAATAAIITAGAVEVTKKKDAVNPPAAPAPAVVHAPPTSHPAPKSSPHPAKDHGKAGGDAKRADRPKKRPAAATAKPASPAQGSAGVSGQATAKQTGSAPAPVVVHETGGTDSSPPPATIVETPGKGHGPVRKDEDVEPRSTGEGTVAPTDPKPDTAGNSTGGTGSEGYGPPPHAKGKPPAHASPGGLLGLR